MRITMVTGSLGLGGAERQMVQMADYWASQGQEVTLVTFTPRGLMVRPGPGVRCISAAVPPTGDMLPARMLNAVKRCITLRRALLRTVPDVVISFLDENNVRVLLATAGSKVPVIVSERNDPHYQLLSPKWEILRKICYRRASCVVLQTHSALEYFPPRIRANSTVIPNPVFPPTVVSGDRTRPASGLRAFRGGEDGNLHIVAMGRLTFQKGFDLLLEAFSLIAGRHSGWDLTIWGEGESGEYLKALVSKLGLAGRVFFPGTTGEPYRELSRADLFVLSSRYEGFPNALCEAMACGVPVVSFDCPSGPGEIIRDGIDGVLVPKGDVRKLAASMDRLMSDDVERSRLAAAASDILDRFSAEKIMGMWEELIARVTGAGC